MGDCAHTHPGSSHLTKSKTDLHRIVQAALAGDVQTVRFLCDRGANASLLTRDGQTARQVAMSRGHAACAEIIAGARSMHGKL